MRITFTNGTGGAAAHVFQFESVADRDAALDVLTKVTSKCDVCVLLVSVVSSGEAWVRCCGDWVVVSCIPAPQHARCCLVRRALSSHGHVEQVIAAVAAAASGSGTAASGGGGGGDAGPAVAGGFTRQQRQQMVARDA